MKQILSDTERAQLDRLIHEAEVQTKAQIVLAVVNRCDNYPEIPWKAFALGASVTGLPVLLYNLLWPGWISNAAVLLSLVVPMAAGAIGVLLTIVIPRFARLFLSQHRVETETRQYAESLFFDRELFATKKRTGILLLVSQFERQVIILPDRGLSNRLPTEVTKFIITQMSHPLSQWQVMRAMETGLDELMKALVPSAPDAQDDDELSNKIIGEGIV